MNNTTNHFEKELKILQEEYGEELVIKDFVPAIRTILDIFGNQGHSGMSASMYANTLTVTLKNAMNQKALSPLRGTDDEYMEIDGLGKYQNNRQSSVFKDVKAGHAVHYYIDAIVWKGEEEYDTFTGTVEGVNSKQTFHGFPFTPKTFYIDVYKDYDTEGKDKDRVVQGDGRDYIYRIKDQKQIDEVRDYYNQP